jgi:hypothetical protein
MMTAAQQMADAAHTADWFVHGAFRPEGFDTDFKAQAVNGCTSLTAARAWLEIDGRGKGSHRCQERRRPDGAVAARPIMGGAPRMAIFSAITDHTAHDRGALPVYARVKGVVPPMPIWICSRPSHHCERHRSRSCASLRVIAGDR